MQPAMWTVSISPSHRWDTMCSTTGGIGQVDMLFSFAFFFSLLIVVNGAAKPSSAQLFTGSCVGNLGLFPCKS